MSRKKYIFAEKKKQRQNLPLLYEPIKNQLLFLFDVYDLFPVIKTALFAHLMRFLQFVAMRAFHQIGSRSLKICISRICSLLRLFRLGYRHDLYTSFQYLRSNIDWLTNYIIFIILCQLFFPVFQRIRKNRNAQYNRPRIIAYICPSIFQGRSKKTFSRKNFPMP